MGSFSITHWLILLVVVVVVFGTSKLKNAGKDLGSAVKGFKDAVKDEHNEHSNKQADPHANHRVLDHDDHSATSPHNNAQSSTQAAEASKQPVSDK